MSRSEGIPAQKRRTTSLKDAMTREETETLLTPSGMHDADDELGDDYREDEDNSFCVDADTEPLTPDSPPVRQKFSYVPQFVPQLPSKVSSNSTAQPENSKSLASSATAAPTQSSNSVRPPKMALLKKKNRHKNEHARKRLGSDPNTFDKSSSVEDSEGNLVPITEAVFQSENGGLDNKANRLLTSGASTGDAKKARLPEAVASCADPSAMGLAPLSEEGAAVEPDNGLYAETQLDNENLQMDGDYMSPADIDDRNLGNIINNLDKVLKDNRLAFIDDFE